MTNQTQTHAPQSGSAAAIPATEEIKGIPFGRLVAVELRKLVDTRAGLWLLIVIGLTTLAACVIVFFAGKPSSLAFSSFISAAVVPLSILLPVLGVLTVTTEWTQRSALVTFALVPRRARIAFAKMVAAMLVGLLATGLAFGLAALLNLLASSTRGGAGTWDLGVRPILGSVGMNALQLLQGVGFGMLFLNTASAIVLFFGLPTVYTMLGGLISAMSNVSEWTDIARTTRPLTAGDAMTSTQWAQLAVSIGIWVLVPVVIGFFRLVRKEVR